MTPETLLSEALTLRDTEFEELARIAEMEHGEASAFVIPYSLERHRQEFAKPGVVCKSIYQADTLVGFVILVLDRDGCSVEFRRIVITEPGHGFGQQAVRLVGELCRNELGRSRVWLDVFATNAWARHVYEKCGYRLFGRSAHEGRMLLLYEKAL